jgi:hypothetical protein
MIAIAGLVLIVLGIASGTLLLLAPFGITVVEPGLTTWIMFPALSVIGYLLIVLRVKGKSIALTSSILGGCTLLLAVAAVVALFAADNGVVTLSSSAASLWYVLALSMVFGVAGLSVGTRVRKEVQEPSRQEVDLRPATRRP